MDQFSEDDVRTALEPYHARIRSAVISGFAEWLSLAECRAAKGYAPVLYPRTISNYVFDAIARCALTVFGSDPTVRIIDQVQTVKFCFGDVVIGRFKKGDEDNLGQNIRTQAVLDFVDAQHSLPGLPPAAAKIEFIWTPDLLGSAVESVLVVARDGDNLLWSYEIDPGEPATGAIPLPFQAAPDDEPPLVTPKSLPSENETKGK